MDKFKALHIINHKAKYHKNKSKVTNRIRMKALYKLKYRCINQWINDFDYVEKHKINGRIYYCFFSPTWSYHIPEDDLITDQYKNLEVKNIPNFESTVYSDVEFTVKNALLYLNDEHNLNGNNFISSEFNKNYEWYYLPSCQSASQE